MPWCTGGGLVAYRKSWLAEAGAEEFPKTWDEYRAVGKKLKAAGHPYGQTAGHTFGDAPGWWYPYLWSWGGKEVEADGKTVVLNTKETVELVKFAVALWKETMDEGGLAWDDTSNNRAFLSGSISATNNGASIYLEAKKKPDTYQTEKGTPMKDDILHAGIPGGAGGQFNLPGPFTDLVMKYSKNQDAAKKFLALGARRRTIFEQVVHLAAGLHLRRDQDVGRRPGVERRPGPGAVQEGPGHRAPVGLCREAEPEGRRGADQVHHRRHVREGDPGHGAAEESVKAAHDELVKIYACLRLAGRARSRRRPAPPIKTNEQGGSTMQRIDRRRLLKLSGAGALAAGTGGLAGILASGRAPAFAQGTTLHWLKFVDFVPVSDQLLKGKIKDECQKALGIKLKIETINGDGVQARITSAIQSKAGPDIMMAVNNWAQLYAESLVDVSDIAEEIGKAQGGYLRDRARDRL